MRTIDADALMDLYANRMVILVEHYGIDSTACGTLSGAMKLLKIQPTIEPKRETGKWKHMGGDEWCCDQCGNVISTEGAWEHPLSDERKMYHCNICGARMVQEGEQDEAD